MNKTVSVTTRTCISISTNYDEDIMNMDKLFNVTVTSDDLNVFVDPDMATASVTIQNSKFYVKFNWYQYHYCCYAVSPPDIEPMVMNVTLGENATFKVLANFSSENLKFQWLHNKTNVSKEGMSSVFTVTNPTKMDGGNYSCIVFFPFGGNITSKEAQLFVCKH